LTKKKPGGWEAGRLEGWEAGRLKGAPDWRRWLSSFIALRPADIFLCLAVLGVVTILFFTLITGSAIQKISGELSLNLISRIFGMILIAIAVQFMVEGLREVFPGWAS